MSFNYYGVKTIWFAWLLLFHSLKSTKRIAWFWIQLRAVIQPNTTPQSSMSTFEMTPESLLDAAHLVCLPDLSKGLFILVPLNPQ